MTNSFQTSISKVCFSWTETNKGFNLHQSAAFESRIDSLKSRKLCKVTWIQSWFANPFWQQEEWIATQEVRLYRNQRKGGKEKRRKLSNSRSYSAGPIQVLFNSINVICLLAYGGLKSYSELTRGILIEDSNSDKRIYNSFRYSFLEQPIYSSIRSCWYPVCQYSCITLHQEQHSLSSRPVCLGSLAWPACAT